MLSTQDSHTEVPESWRRAWKNEQNARKVCDEEILDDVERLLEMRDAGVSGICCSLPTCLFKEMIADWPDVTEYHMKIQRFRQLRQEHQEILKCD